MRRAAIIAVTALVAALLAGPAASADTVCRNVKNRFTGKIEVICTNTEHAPAQKGKQPGGGSATTSPPMMWVRFGTYSVGKGYVTDCELVPYTENLAPGYFRVTAADCGFESATTPPRPSKETVERTVRNLADELQVPDPSVRLGPDPAANQWNMAIVGLPLWLWTDTPRAASSTNSGGGMTIEIQATLQKVTFDMGDGSAPVTCTSWTRYDPATVTPGAASPTCGHTYARPSLPQGSYTVTATAHWSATWSAEGYSDTIDLTSTTTSQVPVGELQSIRDR